MSNCRRTLRIRGGSRARLSSGALASVRTPVRQQAQADYQDCHRGSDCEADQSHAPTRTQAGIVGLPGFARVVSDLNGVTRLKMIITFQRVVKELTRIVSAPD